uniref:Synaptopodin 2 n=1 Tax=Xenopus tropicalis TaxID=8364 RepID=A0A803KAS3_XENTR
MVFFSCSRALNKATVSEVKNGEEADIRKEEYTQSTTLQIRPAPETTSENCDVSERLEDTGEQNDKNSLQSHTMTPKMIETPRAFFPLIEKHGEGRQGAMIELQLSLTPDMQLGSGVPILTVLDAENGSPTEIKGNVQQNETVSVGEISLNQKEGPAHMSSTTFQIVGRQETKIIQTVAADDPSFPRVELILDCSSIEKEEPKFLSDRGCVESKEEGGQLEAPPVAVSFGITAEESEQGEEDPQAERDHTRPHKHRARHARLRRSESLSEKQVKEAKSKCKSIALLLTEAPNPKSKGVLMFKKRRQRARKYTLVSYGTGELEQQDYEEDEDEADKENTFEVTLYGASESDLDEDFFSDPESKAHIVTFDLDTGLLEDQNKTESIKAMEHLPETKGKGVMMFAKRRQRMEQITAEQEETRRQNMEENVTMTENINNAISYQSQQKESIQSHNLVSKSYIEVSSNQERIQNGFAGTYESGPSFQPSEFQNSTALNRTAKPFGGMQNRAALPFSSSRNITSPVSDMPAPPPYSSVTPPPEPLFPVSSAVAGKAQVAVWSPSYPSEQIASRDERIAVPANKTGILQDARRRNTAKPMFTFKEQPKISPNPELLSLVQHREGKRSTAAGNESGPEEDYLSLGAEACNFMQVQIGKQKTPPPVAPKPSVKSPTAMTPVSPVWAPPIAAPTQPQVYTSQNVSQDTGPVQETIAHPASYASMPPNSLNLSGPTREPSKTSAGVYHTYTPKTPPITPLSSNAVAGGVGPAYEMPALSGKGAALFAKRQSRMEKFVVDSATVQAHAARPTSPTPSLPSSWKYSSNVRAPPPQAYNPIQSPLYPPAANKATSKAGSSTAKRKPTKALSPLEVMKHQPYQLKSSLFTFQPPSEAAEIVASKPKSGHMPPARQPQPTKPINTPANSQPAPAYSQPAPAYSQPAPAYSQPSYNTQPSFQASVFTPTEPSPPVGYPMHPRQESPVSALVPPPRPKFSAKKAGVAAQVWKPEVGEE